MNVKNKLWIILLLFILSIIISLLPFGNLVLYPVDLFATYIHEMGHTFATIITGGKAHQISVSPDTSGYAVSCGGFRFLIIQAGYISTAIVGGILLLISVLEGPKLIRYTIAFIGIIMLGCLIFFARDFFTIFSTLFYIGVSFFLVIKTNDIVCQIFLGFISLECCFNSIEDIKHVFGFSISGRDAISDAFKMQELTYIPAPLWAGLWFIISLSIFFGVLLLIYKFKN